MPDFLARITDDLTPSSAFALLVIGTVLWWVGQLLQKSGVFSAHQQIKQAKADGVPVAFIEALRENTQAKKEELAAVRDMGAIIAASNRIAVDQQTGAAKALDTLQAIERSCIEHVALQRQTANEMRALSDKIDDLAREMARRGR